MFLKTQKKLLRSSLVLTAGVLLSNSIFAQAKNYIQKSPNEKIVLDILDNEGDLSYNVKFNDKVIINNSSLGFITDKSKFGNNLTVKGVEKSQFNETWQTVWGQNKNIINNKQ